MEIPSGFRQMSVNKSKPSWFRLMSPLYVRDDLEPGHSALGFIGEQRHQNYTGHVHGGMLASFMDYCLYHAAESQFQSASFVTISMGIDYLAPAPIGQWIQGESEVVRSGKQIAFVRGIASTGDVSVVHATGTFRKLESQTA
jgi:uncharacterized protein (TIGR00369 family)